jgi:TonB family protein
MSDAQDKRLPIAALALGIIGLFTGGLLGVGSVAALGLAAVGLSRARRDPQRYGGRDLAWAAVAASVFGLFSLPLLLALGLTLRPMLAQDDSLPTPVQQGLPLTAEEPPPPPPPPPSRPVGIEAASSAGNEPQPVRVGEGIVEPRKLRSVPPVYPELARQARVQGTVVLECTISPEGRVTDVRVLRGAPLLDEAAIDAVRQWVYTPTLLEGKPVPVIMTVTVNFRLN